MPVAEVRHERHVGAAPPVVWEVLADFDAIVRWGRAVDHSSAMTAQRVGVGATRRIQSGSTVVLERVTEWEPDRVLAYELIGLPPVVSEVTNRWEIRADGAGSAVTLTARVEPGPRPPMRVAARAVARRIGAINAELLDDLAAAAESASRGAPT